MEDQYGDSNWGQTLRDEILGYAVGCTLIATALTFTALVHFGLPLVPTAISISLIGITFSLTITPHIVARWLQIDVGTLLQIDEDKLQSTQPSSKMSQNHSN